MHLLINGANVNFSPYHTKYVSPIKKTFFIILIIMHEILNTEIRRNSMNVIIALVLISIVTVLEVFAYIPQIIKLIKTKSAEDISLTSWLTWMVSDICYLAYVLLESPEAGVIFLASLSLFLVMFVFILTMYYQKSKKLRKEHC